MANKSPALLFVLTLVILSACVGCASSRKSKFNIMNQKSSCDLSHLGKNRYFYTSHYQRMLSKSIRNIGK